MAELKPTRQSYGCRYIPTPSMLLMDEHETLQPYEDIFEKTDILGLLGLKPGEIFYELGSGDGRVLIRAVKKYDAQGRGIENDPDLVKNSRENIKNLGLDDKIKIIEGNYHTVPLHDADAVEIFE